MCCDIPFGLKRIFLFSWFHRADNGSASLVTGFGLIPGRLAGILTPVVLGHLKPKPHRGLDPSKFVTTLSNHVFPFIPKP